MVAAIDRRAQELQLSGHADAALELWRVAQHFDAVIRQEVAAMGE